MANTKRIAVDLGSKTCRIYVPRKGVVVSQPTVLARDEASDEIVAIGDEAVEMIGRAPDAISIISPLQSGVIADFGSTSYLLKAYITEAIGRFSLRKPEAMITVSETATSTEQRAIIDSALESGLSDAHLIKSSIAAALGAGLPITEPRGNAIVDIGAGTTEIGLFSLGGVVASNAIRHGGNAIDDAIARFLRREHGMTVGENELLLIKHEFVDFTAELTKQFTVHGVSILQGLPKTVTIKLGQLLPYIETVLERIIIAIRRVLEQSPPDLIGDIIKYGLMVSGGSAQLKGIAEYFSKRLHVAVTISQDPMLCSIKGAHMALTHIDEYKRSLLT